jgi:hypothetical protein
MLIRVISRPAASTLPRGRPCWGQERPRVFFPVFGAGEADLLDLLVGPVIPAVDLAVLVRINIDTHRARPVHVAPRINRAVSVGVVLEELQLAGFRVVHGLDSLRPHPPLAPGRDDRRKNDTNQQRLTSESWVFGQN